MDNTQNAADTLKKKHDESMREYPFLDLADKEYVLRVIQRSPGKKIITIVITGLIVLLAIIFLISYPLFLARDFTDPDYLGVFFFCIGIIALAVLVCFVSITNNKRNRLFLTNESIIQEIQLNPMSHEVNTINLVNIEGASYLQEGLLANLFNFGSIEILTDNSDPYRFNFADNPKHEAAILNQAIEAFKAGSAAEG